LGTISTASDNDGNADRGSFGKPNFYAGGGNFTLFVPYLLIRRAASLAEKTGQKGIRAAA
jgi:hypothetical protein